MRFKTLCLGVVFVSSIAAWLWQNRQTWLDKYDVPYWQDVYEDSQLARGDAARTWLSDYDAYAIVGYKYWHGDNPLSFHTEAPPLGKYLIGLAIVLFGNQNIAGLIAGMASLGLIYCLGRQVFGHTRPALATVLLVSIDPQFRELLVSSNLDIWQLFWLLVSLVSFLAGLTRPRWFYLANFSLGLFMVTKIYFSGLVVLAAYFGYLLLLGNFAKFMTWVSTLVFLPLGYILPYVPGLVYQPSLSGFIRFQRWLTDWWAGSAQVGWGGIFTVLFTGRWYTWWDRGVVNVANWHLLWPISVAAAAVATVSAVRSRTRSLLVGILLLLLLSFFSFTAFFPRYLILILPFSYLLLIYLLINLPHARR